MVGGISTREAEVRVSRTRLTWVAALFVLLAVSTTGCSSLNSKMTYSGLKGVWYLTSTGGRYDFVSETRLVMPSVQKDGGNAIAYGILPGNKLELNIGGATQVVDIKKLDANQLVVGDFSGGADRTYVRNLNDTAWFKERAKIADGALSALKRFGQISPSPKIVWIVDPPSGDIQPWPLWSTSSLARYRDAWNWDNIKRSSSDVKSQGSGDSAGYSVSFRRAVPTTQDVAAYLVKTGQTVEAGGPFVDVGYSLSKAKYPAGAFLYVGGGLLYSLGDGYAMKLKIGPGEAQGFTPYTYR